MQGLERAKADVEEDGRLRVALLEAQTSARVAELVAKAKGQYPAAVGRALNELKQNPEVYAAYNELYELSVLKPHRTTAFVGFGSSDHSQTDQLREAFIESQSQSHSILNSLDIESYRIFPIGQSLSR